MGGGRKRKKEKKRKGNTWIETALEKLASWTPLFLIIK
jgi:hypothetical protein